MNQGIHGVIFSQLRILVVKVLNFKYYLSWKTCTNICLHLWHLRLKRLMHHHHKSTCNWWISVAAKTCGNILKFYPPFTGLEWVYSRLRNVTTDCFVPQAWFIYLNIMTKKWGMWFIQHNMSVVVWGFSPCAKMLFYRRNKNVCPAFVRPFWNNFTK